MVNQELETVRKELKTVLDRFFSTDEAFGEGFERAYTGIPRSGRYESPHDDGYDDYHEAEEQREAAREAQRLRAAIDNRAKRLRKVAGT